MTTAVITATITSSELRCSLTALTQSSHLPLTTTLRLG